MGFLNAFNRIRLETDLQTQEQLARFLGIKQSSVSGAKKRGGFPRAWAEKVGRHYNLRYEWIMEGIEPRGIVPNPDHQPPRLSQGFTYPPGRFKTRSIGQEQIQEWLDKLWRIFQTAPDSDIHKLGTMIDEIFQKTSSGTKGSESR